MKKTNKKGFTIVELVIVIAVIAILSAVLIPTFTSIVAKANLAADKQTVRQLNVALASSEKADTYNEMADALETHGFNAKYDKVAAPASIGHAYFWSVQYNTIVLVKDNAVVFPENDSRFTSFDANDQEKWLQISTGYYVVNATTANDVVNAIAGGNSFDLGDTTIGTITMPAGDKYVKGADVVYALGENTLDLKNDKAKADYIKVDGAGNKLTIKSGTVITRGIYALNGAEVVIEEGVTIVHDDTDGGSPIRAKNGAKITINGGKFEVLNGIPEPATDAERDANSSVLYSMDSEIIINGGEFIAEQSGAYAINIIGGSAQINNAVVKGARGVVYASNASVTIQGGTYEQLCDNTSGHVFCAEGTGSINVIGATVTHITSVSAGNVTIA